MTICTFAPLIDPNAISSEPAGISDSGDIVGFELGFGGARGFADLGGTFTAFGYPGAAETFAYGVNNAGEIVGNALLSGSGKTQGFSYVSGTFTPINYPGAAGTAALGVSDAGEIVGTYANATGQRGFADNGGTFTTISYPGASSTAADGISGSGKEIVGQYTDSKGAVHGFSDIGGTFATIDVPGAKNTEVYGVNNLGQISGTYYDAAGNMHGFVESGGSFSTLDYPGADQTLVFGISDQGQVVGYSQTAGAPNTSGFVATPVCFAAGTAIRTSRGDVAIEHLAIGDLAVMASGEHRPIRWLGHRTVDCRRHPHPEQVMPVRINAHAFAPNRPARDLFVSPGHAICLDMIGEVLIPAGALVNGATIQQVESERVAYWHVELESHDIILAENLAAESYLDMGNRGFFREAAVVDLAAGPDAIQRSHADFCRPFHDAGPLVEAVRAQLRDRAIAFGWTLEASDASAGLHLVVDGERVDPVRRDLVARFTVPRVAHDVWLVSETARPCEIAGSADRRDLGVCLGGLTIGDGFTPPYALDLADPRLGLGFHEPEEGGRRWTAGSARLPAALWSRPDSAAAEGFFLRVDLARPAVPRWIAPEDPARHSRRPSDPAFRSWAGASAV